MGAAATSGQLPSTSLDDGAVEKGTDRFAVFSARFSSGAADGGTFSVEETATSVSPVAHLDIGGKPARGWTVHTDVLPDYHHTRTAVHRVWYLPYSRYVLYTYGTLTKAQDAQVDQILASARFATASLPLDCADAIDYMDTVVAGRQPAGDDPSQSCLDLTLSNSAAPALDPGTVDTKTETECLLLIRDFDSLVVPNGGDPRYAPVRRRCDLPHKS